MARAGRKFKRNTRRIQPQKGAKDFSAWAVFAQNAAARPCD
jgi:hypothetical protein